MSWHPVLDRIFYSKFFKYITLILIILFAMNAATIVLKRKSISREDLNLGEANYACPEKDEIFSLNSNIGNHSREIISDFAFPFALASYNSYKYSDDKEFVFDNFKYKNFSRNNIVSNLNLPTNLSIDPYLDTYVDEQNGVVILAFRGTIASEFIDWYSNFSWITGILPFKNHYDSARIAMIDIRTYLDEKYPGKNFAFIATGHSLGGALAQHVAAGFPCTQAVVFDTSFVDNSYMYREPFANSNIIHVYDKGDELTYLKTHFFRWISTSQNEVDLDVNVVNCGTLGYSNIIFICKNFQHSSQGLAVGMSRLVADCQTDPENSGCRNYVSKDTSIRDLYCKTYGAPNKKSQDLLQICEESWIRNKILYRKDYK